MRHTLPCTRPFLAHMQVYDWLSLPHFFGLFDASITFSTYQVAEATVLEEVECRDSDALRSRSSFLRLKDCRIDILYVYW